MSHNEAKCIEYIGNHFWVLMTKMVEKKEKHGYAITVVIGNQTCVTLTFYLIAC